jgi:hypothetical protein
MEGRTTFVVSSRLGLFRRADVILVIEEGRLADQGTHEELVRRPGPYHETAVLQIMDLGSGREPGVPGTGPAPAGASVPG